MTKKKLIEVSLPLEAINEASAHEKSIRIGHPSSLHLWWARRPLAAARAVIWASLVDDPSSHPEFFPTEEEQNIERQRLFKILEELVKWENSNNKSVLQAAKTEIMKATSGKQSMLIDPFAGGGAIPIEALRLGLNTTAYDLNPVAVMINKALIEIPTKFNDCAPVNQDNRVNHINDLWKGSKGLEADIEYYGKWIKEEAFKRIGHLYPPVIVPKEFGGGEAPVIAWIWARTVTCPNPACGCKIPLSSSFVLCNKKGNEAWVEPLIEDKKIHFTVRYGKCPKDKESLKQGRSAVFKCPVCGSITKDEYVKAEGKAHRIGDQLMAIVAEGNRGRIYLTPNPEHELIAQINTPDEIPTGALPQNPRWFSPPAFGYDEYHMLFTKRQQVMMVTLCDLVKEAQKLIEQDAIKAGMKNDHMCLDKGGDGAKAYGEAISIYLAFAVDKCSDRNSTLCSWMTGVQCPGHVFGRQAMPMIWDYAEANIFGTTGSFESMYQNVVAGLRATDYGAFSNGFAEQKDSRTPNNCLNEVMVSTDPPYYDNIGYADLSDYFYIWMRYMLKEVYPSLFGTMLTPKNEELVATPYHFNGDSNRAKAFFEEGMETTCQQIYDCATDNIPVSIYYAYKQNDQGRDEGQASSGWETMLAAVIRAGFIITGTWPMRTERGNRKVAQGTNALASSIVLVCRKRPKEASQITRRNLINILRRELRPALKKLQESNIAPVDLAQSAIGPGMGVFSRYCKVLEADGTPMSVRSALQVINEEIDLYFNEQVGDLDAMSRFCVELYTQSAFNDIKFGDADILARAKGTSVAALSSHDVVYAKAGTVHLIERTELPEKIDTNESCIWMLTQQLTQAMATGGVEACAKAVFMMFGSNAERAKDLAYRLYTIAEQKKWSTEAYAYNALVVAWPDIQSRAAVMQRETPEQLDMFSMGLLNT